MFRILHTLLLVGALSTSLVAEAPISLEIRSLMGSAPFTTRARISLPPHPDNRYVCLSWQQIRGGNEGRTSCWSVAGEREALTTWKLLKDLSAGKWDVVAYVLRNDEQGTLS